jgi:hypothetical protein
MTTKVPLKLIIHNCIFFWNQVLDWTNSSQAAVNTEEDNLALKAIFNVFLPKILFINLFKHVLTIHVDWTYRSPTAVVLMNCEDLKCGV